LHIVGSFQLSGFELGGFQLWLSPKAEVDGSLKLEKGLLLWPKLEAAKLEAARLEASYNMLEASHYRLETLCVPAIPLVGRERAMTHPSNAP
jgi:hypothetical protein